MSVSAFDPPPAGALALDHQSGRRATSRLARKAALITGGARGQGEAEGWMFAAEGATVYLTDVLAEGQAVADDIGGVFFEHDVTDADVWAAVVKEIIAEHGTIDVLVN